MMLNILRTGLPHIGDKVLSAKIFATADPVSINIKSQKLNTGSAIYPAVFLRNLNLLYHNLKFKFHL